MKLINSLLFFRKMACCRVACHLIAKGIGPVQREYAPYACRDIGGWLVQLEVTRVVVNIQIWFKAGDRDLRREVICS